MATHANPHTPRGNGVSTPRGPACIIHAFTRPLGVYRANYLPFSLGAGGQKVAFAWLMMAGCALRPPPQGRTGKGAPGLSSNPPTPCLYPLILEAPGPPSRFPLTCPLFVLRWPLCRWGGGCYGVLPGVMCMIGWVGGCHGGVDPGPIGLIPVAG